MTPLKKPFAVYFQTSDIALNPKRHVIRALHIAQARKIAHSIAAKNNWRIVGEITHASS